ncbi:MAG: M56 family metallopeptidase [Acidimicrobiia bacterium]|nr:M56 family metallopeptidase [Acidimicrobiia bacterium]
MSTLLVVTGLVLLALPGARRLPSRRLDPAEWARAADGAIRFGHLTVRLGLLLGAAPTVLRAAGVEDAAAACHRMFGPVAPGGPLVGWASAASFCWLSVNHRRAARAQRGAFDRTHVEPWIGDHRLEDGVDIVTLPVDEPLAYAVPRGAGQIVVSEGLRTALDPSELRAVIAHERSHLRNHHERFIGAAASLESCFGWCAPVLRSAMCLRLAVERWADEEAAPSMPERRVVCSALVKTAERMLGPALAFTGGCTVLDRLAALEEDPPVPSRRTRFITLAPLMGLGGFAVAVVAVWSTYTHHGVLGILGFCPT